MDPEDPYSDPDHFQNAIISSFYLFRHILFELFVFKIIFHDPEDPDSGPDHSQN